MLKQTFIISKSMLFQWNTYLKLLQNILRGTWYAHLYKRLEAHFKIGHAYKITHHNMSHIAMSKPLYSYHMF